MLNEKNNSGHWKQKLDDTNFSSAETRLNKEAAWQKLQQRMHKPKRKKAIAYWFVAACVLPLLIVLSWVLQQNKSSAVQGFVYHHNKIKPLIKETVPQQKDAVAVTINLNIEGKKAAAKKVTNNKLIIDTNKKIRQIKNEDSTIGNKEMIADVTDDSLATSHLAVAVKTKLKVVHINELSEPLEAAPVVAHNNYTHSFSMQIGKEEVYANPIKLKRKTGFINLPTKSSSN